MKNKNLFWALISILLIPFTMSCGDDDEPKPVKPIDPTADPCMGIATDVNVIYDFECQKNVTFSDELAVKLTTISNPNKSGVNTTDSVGRYIDNGTDAWDNLLIQFDNEIDLSTVSELSFQLLSSKVVPIIAKIEGGTAVEFSSAVTRVNEWVEYKFDFSSAAGGGNDVLLLFFNAGQTDGSEQDVYHVDNIKWQLPTELDCTGVIPDLSIINDFDCQQNWAASNNGVEVITNPFSGGINTTDSVGLFIDDGGNAWDNLIIEFDDAIDLSVDNQISIQIYSTKRVPLLAKMEGGTAMEIWGEIDVTNEWKEYTFDFSCAEGGGNTKVVLFFNGGQTDGTNEDMYYVDNYRFNPGGNCAPANACDGVEEDLSIINDFDCQQNWTASNDGLQVVANDFKGGINETDSVGLYIDDGGNAWDNLNIEFDNAIDLSVNNQLSIQIYSTMRVPLLAKIEGGTAMEIWGEIDVTNEWKEYTFDFSCAEGGGNTKVVLFFNGGQTDGANEDMYYVDNYRFIPGGNCAPVNTCDGVEEDLSIINDFDCQQNWTASNDGLQVVANDFKGGINETDSVGLFIDDGGNAWDNLIIEFDNAIDLSVNNQLSIQIYSTKRVPLLAKIEGGTAMEIWGEIDVTNEWKEYTFDFSCAEGGGNTKVVLFFNGGQTDGTNEDMYYVDNYRFIPGGNCAPVNTCDGVEEDLSIINDFDCQQNWTASNDGLQVVANDFKGGINETDSVGLFIDDGGNAWDNLIIEFDNAIDLSVNNQLSIQIYSTKRVPLLAKIEGGTAMEIWGEIDVTNEWKEYTFDFSCAEGGGNTKVVLFFNGGQTDGTNEDMYYVDNYRFIPGGNCGATSSCEDVTQDLSIISDFECQSNYVLGGNSAISVENTFKGGINESDSIGRYVDNGTDAWDNLLIDFGSPIDLSIANQLSIKIYSSKTAPLLVKFEGGTSPAAEIWGAIDVVNEWKEYILDFSGQAAESHNKVVFFFNGGESDGTNEDIYFIDDLKFSGQ